MIIGKDMTGNNIALGQRVRRDDGIIGSFELNKFQIKFVYDEAQDNGGTSSLINDCYNYEVV